MIPVLDSKEPRTILYTIGYEGLQPGDFTGILKHHQVSMIIDVREIPHSRKNGFSKKHLSELAAIYNIGYLSLPKLGSPTPVRQKLRQNGDYEEFFEAYKKHMEDQKEDIERVICMAERETCCLLCYEKDANLCHRKIIALEISSRDHGMEVVHL